MQNITGKNIKQIRERMGKTQEQLANQLELAGWKVDRFVISKIERGERQVLDLEIALIARILNVPIGKLFEE